jgi:hypothetical protein
LRFGFWLSGRPSRRSSHTFNPFNTGRPGHRGGVTRLAPVCGPLSSPTNERVLATVLFTDIVGSTEQLSSQGDSRWRHQLDVHDQLVDRSLSKYAADASNILSRPREMLSQQRCLGQRGAHARGKAEDQPRDDPCRGPPCVGGCGMTTPRAARPADTPKARSPRRPPSDANVNAAADGTDCPYSSRRGFRWRLPQYRR